MNYSEKNLIIAEYYDTLKMKGGIKEMIGEFNDQFLMAYHKLDNQGALEADERVYQTVGDYLEVIGLQCDIEDQMTVLFNNE